MKTILAVALLALSTPAVAQLSLKQDGGTIGPVSSVNCVGPNVTCSRSGATWVLEASGGGGSSGINTPEVIADRITAQTLANGFFTRIQFNTVAVDTDSIVTTGASWHATIATTGTYEVTALVTLNLGTGPGSGREYDVCVSVWVNGVEVRASRIDRKTGKTSSLNNGHMTFGAGGVPFQFSAGDEVSINVYHSSGGSVDIEHTEGINRFALRRVR